MIFVIEDDRGWEKYYRRILKDYKMEFFHDGVEAIAAMDEEIPELVILDILLTGPTGFAVLNEMRSYPELAEVPVIIVTSVSIKDAPSEQYGVTEVLDKGKMTPQELIGAVQGALK
ncbi:response regulator [Candidatus Saccharibacteria bacterium]|nr:response regulator [Candidatus Saccharibacteria bacterium]